MPFNVNFYTFSKKHQSTAVPSGTGMTVSCHANQTLDILAPEIVLDWRQESGVPTVYNYARISDFGRYYWITGWRNDGGIWHATLKVDTLASWKTQIGGNTVYVFRSSSAYDGDVADSLYPITAEQHHLQIALARPWTIGADSAAGTGTADTYTVLCTVIGGHGTRYYAMTTANWEKVASYIYTNKYYEDFLGEFGAAEYPEAKTVIDPADYIQNLFLLPMPIGSGSWQVSTSGNALSYIEVGLSLVPDPDEPSTLQAWRIPDNGLLTWNYSIQLGADFWHPQADERGDWLNLSPYTSYELFYPPFGIIPLDASEIAHAEYLDFRLSIDPRICQCMLEVRVAWGIRSKLIYRATASCGIPIPLSGAIPTGSESGRAFLLARNVLGNLESGLKGNVLGALEGMQTAYVNAMHNVQPHLSNTGGPGSSAALYGSPVLYVVHYYMADDDLNGRGRPLMSTRQISAIPGYIVGDSDEISVPCTAMELEEIKAAVASGFFYE